MTHKFYNPAESRYATDEEKKYLRVNPDMGIVELFCYRYTIPSQNITPIEYISRIDELKASMCWQPAPEWVADPWTTIDPNDPETLPKVSKNLKGHDDYVAILKTFFSDSGYCVSGKVGYNCGNLVFRYWDDEEGYINLEINTDNIIAWQPISPYKEAQHAKSVSNGKI